jgi:hypothetical protein
VSEAVAFSYYPRVDRGIESGVMIEIFDPTGVDYSVERAKQELAAAKAAALLKARAAHLAIAAGHMETIRNGGARPRTPGRNSLPLRIAFAVNDDGGDFDQVLLEIDAVTTN